MPMQLTRRAKVAIVALRDEFRLKVHLGEGIVKPTGYWERLQRDYETRLTAIIREGMEEVCNDRDMRIECPDCHRQGTVPGDQVRWSCSCSPRVERFTFQTSI